MKAQEKATLAQHIQELRSRLKWSVLALGVGSILGYMLHEFLLEVLQRPINQTLYYTTPSGALSFIIKLCVAFGFIVALPVIIYQVMTFFSPVISRRSKQMILFYVLASVVLAGTGIAFAYFISLPAALHFLTGFSAGTGIESWLGVDEYFNFVLAYIVGFAALFQLPIVLSFINRIKPLTPKKLMGSTRYVVLFSFIAAAIITPTPDPLNQALMAGPVIGLYLVSALVIMVINATKNRGVVANTPVAPRSKSTKSIFTEPKPTYHVEPQTVGARLVPKPLVLSPAVSSYSIDGIKRTVPIVQPVSRPIEYVPIQRAKPQPVRLTPGPRLQLISDFV